MSVERHPFRRAKGSLTSSSQVELEALTDVPVYFPEATPRTLSPGVSPASSWGAHSGAGSASICQRKSWKKSSAWCSRWWASWFLRSGLSWKRKTHRRGAKGAEVSQRNNGQRNQIVARCSSAQRLPTLIVFPLRFLCVLCASAVIFSCLRRSPHRASVKSQLAANGESILRRIASKGTTRKRLGMSVSSWSLS